MASSSNNAAAGGAVDPTSPAVVFYGKRTANGKRTDVSKLRPGDFLSCTQLYKVKDVGNGRVTMVTISTCAEDVGHESHSTVEEDLVEAEYDSLQVHEKIKVNKTQLGRIAAEARGSVVEFKFYKKPTEKRGAELLDNADISTPAKRRKITKEILRGEERVMKCTVLGVNEVTGRADVLDLAIDTPNNKRQVDLRTVERCVFRGRETHV